MPARGERLTILRGTLDTLVLQACAARPLHGFEISVWLDEHAAEPLHLDDSALYQALHRLEHRGCLSGEWGVSGNNRRAKYYRVTAEGRRLLDKERARLLSFASTITALLTPRRGR